MFAFPSDIVDEGYDVALDRIRNRAGVSGLTLAALYHAARDIFPHNPRRRVGFIQGGFTVLHARAGSLRPASPAAHAGRAAR